MSDERSTLDVVLRVGERLGVPLHTLTALRFDRDVGKHGDTAHGETAPLLRLDCSGHSSIWGIRRFICWTAASTPGKILEFPSKPRPWCLWKATLWSLFAPRFVRRFPKSSKS
jgi:hypothetical protein